MRGVAAMIIDFEKMDELASEHLRGGEKVTYIRRFTDDKNKIMMGRLEPGASVGYHRHEDDCEMVYILEGKGKVVLENGEEKVWAGVCHYCPKGEAHSLVNDSDKSLIFFAVVPKQ